MSSKSGAVCLNSGTVLSVFCLLLCFAGFIRIELKFNDHEARLMAVEDVISQMHSRKQRFMMDDTSIQGNVTMKDFKKKEDNSKMVLHRFTRQVTSNKPFENSTKIRLILEDVVTSSFKKICQNTGTWNVCPRGLPGPPGRDGPKGDKGDRGRRGKKGMMGQPGRSGKQGIMGPPGIRGGKGVKGDIGASGVPGMKGEQGESISAPKVAVSSSHLTVNESNTAALLCSVSGNPVPQVAWSRVGGVLPSNRTKVSSEGLLQINEVRLEDAGNYKCVARNILGREEKLASLAIQSQPKTSLSFGPSYVVKGKNITLPACHVTGYPSPKISWHKVPGNLVQARTVMKDGRLSIMNAHKSDSGLYKCEASNNLGRDSAVTQLNVVELPHFTVSPPSQLKVSTVQNITVPCQATGDPQPTIMWRKEGGKLPAGRSSVSANGTLKIWNLREREDSGRYTCVASSNHVFMAFFVMDVIIVYPKVYKNCAALYKAGQRTSGVYRVSPDEAGYFDVYCDQTTAGGGWTVFQKRLDGSVDFDRVWNDYKQGFGNLSTEFWLGLDKIHRLTKGRSKLRVDLEDFNGQTAYAEYDLFEVADEGNKYRLTLGTYSGTAGDSFTYHKGMAFSATDQDNDNDSGNCAASWKGGWWFNKCHYAFLNGFYYHGSHSHSWDGVIWYKWKGDRYSAKRAEMKIKPVNA